MTIDEFKKATSDGRFICYFNYAICISVIAGGSLLFYKMVESGNNVGTYLPLIVPIFLIFFGVYGIWELRKDYFLTEIISAKSIIEKDKIIVEFLNVLNIRKRNKQDNFYQITYTNQYWNIVELYIYFDEQKYYIKAKSPNPIGATDFGLSSRAVKRIENYIKENL